MGCSLRMVEFAVFILLESAQKHFNVYQVQNVVYRKCTMVEKGNVRKHCSALTSVPQVSVRDTRPLMAGNFGDMDVGLHAKNIF